MKRARWEHTKLKISHRALEWVASVAHRGKIDKTFFLPPRIFASSSPCLVCHSLCYNSLNGICSMEHKFFTEQFKAFKFCKFHRERFSGICSKCFLRLQVFHLQPSYQHDINCNSDAVHTAAAKRCAEASRLSAEEKKLELSVDGGGSWEVVGDGGMKNLEGNSLLFSV